MTREKKIVMIYLFVVLFVVCIFQIQNVGIRGFYPTKCYFLFFLKIYT